MISCNDLHSMAWMVGKGGRLDAERQLVINKDGSLKVFREDFTDSNVAEIDYWYIPNKPEGVKFRKDVGVVSLISKDYIENPKKYYKNMNNAVNRWTPQVRVTTKLPLFSEIEDLCKRWVLVAKDRYFHGVHITPTYMYFSHYYEMFKDSSQVLFFYLGDKLIGFHCLQASMTGETDDGYPVVRFPSKKVDTTVGGEISQFVDFYAVREMHKKVGDFIMHSACAGKTVEYYKDRVFPPYRHDIYYFYKVSKPVAEPVVRKLF